MSRVLRLVCALWLVLALAIPAGAAPSDPTAPPSGAPVVALGASRVNVTYFVGPDAGTLNASINAGMDGVLWVALEGLAGNRTVAVEVASATLQFDNASLAFLAGGNDTWSYRTANFLAPAQAGNASYQLTVRVLDNGTQVGQPTVLSGVVLVEAVSAPLPAPSTPVGYYVGGGALLVVVLGVVVYGVRQRSIRRRMNEGPRRSQVMREMALEKELEKAKEPEKVAEIKAEIRQQEQVREKRRELQILEAKRADALKTMDLLRKRHEAGGLTKLQYDTMLAKRQADLERIEREIAEMEAADGSGSAAA